MDVSEAKIRELIATLDARKNEAIERTFKGVAKHFREVFAELVPGKDLMLCCVTVLGMLVLPDDQAIASSRRVQESISSLEAVLTLNCAAARACGCYLACQLCILTRATVHHQSDCLSSSTCACVCVQVARASWSCRSVTPQPV